MKVRFLDLGATYSELKPELDAAYYRVMDSGQYLFGSELRMFEQEFAAAVGSTRCVGVGSGLDALILGLRALDVGLGDEVIVPANTYIATWLAVSGVGATIVPVDPNPGTFNIDADRVEEAITSRTRAIIPVHLYGLPADMLALCEVGRQHGVPILADAAQAHGAAIDGVPIGAFGDLVAWSFYPGKNLGAYADGGAVTTSHGALADRISLLRNYGSKQKYVNLERGVNSRLDELSASVLRVKLRHLDNWNSRRMRIARRYDETLAEIGWLETPSSPPNYRHVYHQYVVRVTERAKLQSYLSERGIDTLVHYPIPPYAQQAYASFRDVSGRLPVSNALHASVISLPIGPHLPVEEALYVSQTIVDYGATR